MIYRHQITHYVVQDNNGAVLMRAPSRRELAETLRRWLSLSWDPTACEVLSPQDCGGLRESLGSVRVFLGCP